MRFAIPLCGSFLWCDPLWSYGMKSGFAEKHFFKLRQIVFFTHVWTASNPHKMNMWVDLGNVRDLKRCFPQWLEENWGFAEKQFFKLRQIVFFTHVWTASNPRKINMWIDLGTWNIVFPHNLKSAPPSPALQKTFFSGSIFFFFACLLSNHPVTSFKLAPNCADACNT